MNDFAPGAAPPRGPQFDNRRVLAGLIDVLIVGVVAAVIGVAAGAVGGESGQWSPALSAVALGWGLFYYFALESGAGQTVGKRLLGLRVTMADGSQADMRAIAIRTVLRVIDGIGLYVVGLIVMLVSGERRQRLGDMAGGTIITSADFEPAAAPASSAPAPTSAVVLPSAPEAPVPTPTPELSAPLAEPTPVVKPDPAPVAVDPEPAPVAVDPPAPVVEAPPAVEPTPVVESAPAAFEPAAPAVEPEPAPTFFEAPASSDPAPVDVPAAPTPSVPELTPVQPFSAPAPENGAVPEHGTVAEDETVSEPEDEPVKVRSVETISNIDLLMGDVEEDEAAGRRP